MFGNNPAEKSISPFYFCSSANELGKTFKASYSASYISVYIEKLKHPREVTINEMLVSVKKHKWMKEILPFISYNRNEVP